MRRKHIHAKIVAANLISLGGLMALPAQATLLVNTLTATATTSVDGSTSTSTGPSSDPNYISNYRSDFGVNSSTSASAWGNSYGTYRAGADGSGVFNSTGRFQREVQLTNNNGYATDYSLDFFIYYGSMSASNNTATGSGYGSYDLSIKQGINTLFASGATLQSDGSLVITGTQLDGASQSGDYYSWGGTYVTLNLGTLADGASTTINFDLVSTAFGNFGFDGLGGSDGYGGYGGCYGGYGGDAARSSLDGYGGGCTGTVYAALGDPNDFLENGEGNPSVTVRERASNQVPLPGTLPLMALGLAGLVFSRKSRIR